MFPEFPQASECDDCDEREECNDFADFVKGQMEAAARQEKFERDYRRALPFLVGLGILQALAVIVNAFGLLRLSWVAITAPVWVPALLIVCILYFPTLYGVVRTRILS